MNKLQAIKECGVTGKDKSLSDIWQHEVADVSPLRNHRYVDEMPSPTPIHIPYKRYTDIFCELPDVNMDAPLRKIDHNMMRRIKQGRLHIHATLDLHGLSAVLAHDTLIQFVTEAYAAKMKMLLVVTGKGRLSETGLLKRSVPIWCADMPLRAIIAGIGEAHVTHGGSGACYIQLRQNKGEHL